MCFVVLDAGCLFPLTGALEVLRLANRELGEPRFVPIVTDAAGAPSRFLLHDGNGAQAHLLETQKLDYCFVVASEPGSNCISPLLLNHLRRSHRFGMIIGGIDAGVFELATSGFLAGKRCSLDRRFMACFREKFTKVTALESLFEIDDRCITSAGGIAAAEMMLWLTGQWLDRRHAEAISRQLQLGCVRPAGQEQPHQPTVSLMVRTRSVRRAIEMLEDTNCPGITPVEVAHRLGISVRQLERLFKRHLGVTPGRFLREVKLRRANQLLTYTDLSTTEVAISVGFTSVSHFSRLYKRQFGITPAGR